MNVDDDCALFIQACERAAKGEFADPPHREHHNWRQAGFVIVYNLYKLGKKKLADRMFADLGGCAETAEASKKPTF